MVASAELDPIVVVAELSDEGVARLFAAKRESAKLDYKVTWDASDQRDIVGIAKDILAMANTAGGYILIGAGDTGQEIGLSDEQVKRIDEATLRGQLLGFAGVAVDLFLNKGVVHNGRKYCVVTVLRSNRSPIVAKKDGQYDAGGKPAAAFRQGDVLVRHGSASEKWNQDDVATIYARVVEREKDRWIREIAPDFVKLVAAMRGEAPAPAPEAALRADPESFQRSVQQMVRDSLD